MRSSSRPASGRRISLQLPAEFVIVFEPVTHAAQFIDVKGEPTRERQALMLTYNKVRAPTGTMELRPGPLRLSLDNRTDVRVLPSVWIAGDMLHDLLGKRKPFLTANRLLSNQTFRDIYRTDTLDVDQGLKITASRSCSPTSRARPRSMSVSATLWRTTWCARTFVSCMRSWRRKRAPWSRRSETP